MSDLSSLGSNAIEDSSVPSSARRFGARLGLLGFAVMAFLFGSIFPRLEAETVRKALVGQGLVVSLTDNDELFLEATPLQGEGLWAFSRRLTGGTEAVEEISSSNGRPRRLLSGVRYRVPYGLLVNELQVQVIRALFPEAEARPEGFRLVVPASYSEIDLWQVAAWLTGSGENFSTLRQLNQLDGSNAIQGGTVLLVPRNLLQGAFLSLLPPPPPTQIRRAATPSDGGPLTYENDAAGRWAVYRLKRGEALYSAVVARFTGRITAKEVNELAAELARLNDIPDVTDMPVGQPIRIPVDLLLAEYLPPDDPRRQEWETDRVEVAKYSNTVRASRLEGITIILDAGHGGDDPGVDYKGTWESVYVYDVMTRIRRLLEQTTAARVVATTRDGDAFKVLERDVLPRSRNHAVMTNPKYSISDTRVSAHLRWYLANSHHRKAVRTSRDDGKTLFISLHADALHSSLRGSMIYVPSTSLTKGTFGKTGSVYSSRKEVKEKPQVSYSWKERTRSEGLSRQFAEQLLSSFRRHRLQIHREKPVRDRIIRCRRCRPFVPAVVRYNAVPTKILLEICNMNNSADRNLLRTRKFRETVARAVLDGILTYYGQPVLEAPIRVTDLGEEGQSLPIAEGPLGGVGR